jgi:anti-sigma regulatory factor (Ser/Thr protein kinase)
VGHQFAVTTFRALYASRYESVAEARRAVAQFADRCGFDRSDISDIILAVGEACNNAAEHGHVDRGHFTVGCAFEDDLLKTEVKDGGGGFQPEAGVETPSPVQWLGRGRGIPIMRALMDRVTFRVTARGTTVILEKRKLASSAGETLGEPGRLDADCRSQARQERLT